MFQTDGPLMRAQQPAFQQRDDPMDARQQFRRVALAAQDRDLTSVAFAVERQVAQPTIRMYHAARRNRLLHEGHQTARRSVRDATHANASDAPAPQSTKLRTRSSHTARAQNAAATPCFPHTGGSGTLPASAPGKDSHDRLPPIGSAFRSPPACADSLPWPATLPVVVT